MGMRPLTRQGPPGIRGLVEYAISETAQTADRPPHRGLPSADLVVVFSSDSPLLCSPTFDDWTVGRGSRHDVCLGGFHLDPVYLHRPDRQEGVQVGIHPLAARRVLGLPAAALTELTQEGEDVLGPQVRALFSRVASGTPEQRSRLVTDGLAALASRHERAPEPRREVVGAWRLLERSRGRMRIADVAFRVGLSTRHLSSLIKAESGIGTKQLADLLRFDAAHARLVAALRQGTTPHLAGIAHAHGYADHAHLDRAYRQFAGTSPTGWITDEFRNIQAGGRSSRPHSGP